MPVPAPTLTTLTRRLSSPLLSSLICLTNADEPTGTAAQPEAAPAAEALAPAEEAPVEEALLACVRCFHLQVENHSCI
jgi:hypothetical protein